MRPAGRFVGMVVPGETIRVRHAQVSDSIVRYDVLAGSGVTPIDQGFAVLT